MTMKTTSVAELKRRLSAYLRAVRSGEEIVVTDRGTPVARLVPMDEGFRRDERAAALVREGLARPPAGDLPADFWDRPRPQDPAASVRQALLEDRAEGR